MPMTIRAGVGAALRMAHEPHCEGDEQQRDGEAEDAERAADDGHDAGAHITGQAPPDRRGDDDRQAETGQAEAVAAMLPGPGPLALVPTRRAPPPDRHRPCPATAAQDPSGTDRGWRSGAGPAPRSRASAVGGGGTAGPADALAPRLVELDEPERVELPVRAYGRP